jgi:hypothetical protein
MGIQEGGYHTSIKEKSAIQAMLKHLREDTIALQFSLVPNDTGNSMKYVYWISDRSYNTLLKKEISDEELESTYDLWLTWLEDKGLNEGEDYSIMSWERAVELGHIQLNRDIVQPSTDDGSDG